MRLTRFAALLALAACIRCSSSSINTTPGTGGSGGGGTGAGTTGGTAGDGGGAAGVQLDSSVDAPLEGAAGAPSACADGSIEQTHPPSNDMVGCDGGQTQCDAETLCGAGWHLCTFSEYAARGGDFHPGTTQRWLKSCVYATTPTEQVCPTDEICQPCSTLDGPAGYVSFNCSDEAQATLSYERVGILSSASPTSEKPGCVQVKCTHVTEAPVHIPAGATCCL